MKGAPNKFSPIKTRKSKIMHKSASTYLQKSIPTSSSQSDIERTLAYLFHDCPHIFLDAAKTNTTSKVVPK